MNQYTFIAEPSGVEIKVVADNEKSAHTKAWNTLSDDDMNITECLECIDVEPVESPEKRILNLEAQVASLLKDKARLDWLDQNIFHRENKDDWDKRMYPRHNMWVLFSPKPAQGTSRNIIDEAMK